MTTFTTQDIYKLANEITETEFNILLNGFNNEEEMLLNSLVKLGDRKEVALYTVIAKRYDNVEQSKIYQIAYYS